MKINVLLGIIIFGVVTTLAVSENLPAFIDAASLIIVLGGAFCFGLSSGGGLFSDERLEAASEGAVISGWLGLLYGAVIIAGNLTDMAALGPATAVAILTVIYGYLFKAIIRMILLSRDYS